MRYDINGDMKRYLIGFLLLMIFLVCVGLANAQTKARPTDPALPYVVTFSQPAKGGTFTVTPDGGSALKSGETVYSGKAVTIQATASLSEVKVYKTGDAATTVAWVKVDEKTYTFTMPAYPVTVDVVFSTYVVTYAAPANGTLALSLVRSGSSTSFTSGENVSAGSSVQIETTCTDAKYIPSLGYPKVCRDGGSGETVPYSKIDGKQTFVMPSFPVKVEMKYEAIPSGENRLKSVGYTVNGGQPVLLSGFTSGTLVYNITLPAGTTGTVTLTGQRMDGQTDVTASVSLNATGTTTVTLKVTAEDGTSRTYTFHFVIAKPDSYIVTLAPGLDGGTVAAALADGKVVKSGDAVAEGTELTLSNTPLKGYDFSTYTVTGGTLSDGNKVTVAKQAVTISASFTKTEEIKPDELGKPAITQPSGSDPAPVVDAPVVIIPDAGALPLDTELSELRLIKDEATEENTKKVEQLATTNNLKPENMDVMEITLVQIVTTTSGTTGKETTTITPVQPGDKVKVRIPYPAGKTRKDFNFTVIHLKSDGTTEAYTVTNGGLSLQEGYMELTIASFSPFGIAWTPKPSTPDPTPDPDPDPTPDPSGYTLVIPEVTGATTYPAAGLYYVTDGDRFEFTLTLDKSYDKSTPVVTIRQGDKDSTLVATILPDGRLRYEIKQVGPDMEILITGVSSNPSTPTANAEVEGNALRVWSADGLLHIDSPEPAEVYVYDFGGTLLKAFRISAGHTATPVRQGACIIRIGKLYFKQVL